MFGRHSDSEASMPLTLQGPPAFLNPSMNPNSAPHPCGCKPVPTYPATPSTRRPPYAPEQENLRQPQDPISVPLKREHTIQARDCATSFGRTREPQTIHVAIDEAPNPTFLAVRSQIPDRDAGTQVPSKATDKVFGSERSNPPARYLAPPCRLATQAMTGP